MSFFKNRGQEGKQVLFGHWHRWEEGGYEDRV
jgi:chitinase